jgi:hypothetical protein
MAASYWTPNEEMAMLLGSMDEPDLRSFATALQEDNHSQAVLYSARYEIYVRTKTTHDLDILINTAESILPAMLERAETETYAEVAMETSKLFRERFERTLDVDDLDRAIKFVGEANSVASRDSATQMEYLSSLLDIKENLAVGTDREEEFESEEDPILERLPKVIVQISNGE